MIVAGGRVTSTPGDELASVEVMVVGQPYWSFKAPLPQPRLAPAMVVLGGKPLLTGGSYEVKYLLSHRNSGVQVDLRMIRGAFKTNFR